MDIVTLTSSSTPQTADRAITARGPWHSALWRPASEEMRLEMRDQDDTTTDVKQIYHYKIIMTGLLQSML